MSNPDAKDPLGCTEGHEYLLSITNGVLGVWCIACGAVGGGTFDNPIILHKEDKIIIRHDEKTITLQDFLQKYAIQNDKELSSGEEEFRKTAKPCDLLKNYRLCDAVGWNMLMTSAPCYGIFENCPIYKMHRQMELLKSIPHDPWKDTPILKSKEELRKYLQDNKDKLKSKSSYLPVSLGGELHFARIDDDKITLHEMKKK